MIHTQFKYLLKLLKFFEMYCIARRSKYERMILGVASACTFGADVRSDTHAVHPRQLSNPALIAVLKALVWFW